MRPRTRRCSVSAFHAARACTLPEIPLRRLLNLLPAGFTPHKEISCGNRSGPLVCIRVCGVLVHSTAGSRCALHHVPMIGFSSSLICFCVCGFAGRTCSDSSGLTQNEGSFWAPPLVGAGWNSTDGDLRVTSPEELVSELMANKENAIGGRRRAAVFQCVFWGMTTLISALHCW